MEGDDETGTLCAGHSSLKGILQGNALKRAEEVGVGAFQLGRGIHYPRIRQGTGESEACLKDSIAK